MEDHASRADLHNNAQNRPSLLRQIVVALLFLAAVTVTAALGSLATIANTDGWYRNVEKVAWNPPDWVFGPAWTILYIAIALAGFLLWKSGYLGRGQANASAAALRVFVLQLVLNFMWTPIFFAGFPVLGETAWWVALAVILALVASVVWLISLANTRSKAATILLLPYLLWIIFASTLNAGIIVLNQ